VAWGIWEIVHPVIWAVLFLDVREAPMAQEGQAIYYTIDAEALILVK